MRIAFFVCIVFLTACAAGAATFDEAVAAYRQNKVAAAEAGYKAVLANPESSALAKARSARELGRIAWLIDGNADAAMQWFDAADRTGDEVCVTAALRVRVQRESGAAADPAGAAQRALENCATVADADELRWQTVAALVERYSSRRDDAALAEARRWAGQFSQASRGNLDVQRTRVALAVTTGDAATAADAWKAFFWLLDGDAPPALAEYSGRVGAVFAAGLDVRASVEAQSALIAMLIRGGFGDAASRFADRVDMNTRGARDERWLRSRAYFSFIATVRGELTRDYRSLARGGSARGFESAVGNALKSLARAPDVKTAWPALGKEFGIYGTLGETSGYPAMHAGHVVEDMRREVSQYGRTGSIRFIVIDNEFSNGFESWLWDGWAFNAGWADGDDVIIQVRYPYARAPRRALALVGDTPERKTAEAEIAQQAAVEAAARPAAFLPSVSSRLRLRAADEIATMARAAGGDFETAFLRTYWITNVEQSIFLHEGRHVLDKKAEPEVGRLSVEQREFRAKLSELGQGTVPVLALASMYTDLIGSSSPHGRANRRIADMLAAWIDAHRADVAGFDPAKPAMAQLPLLTAAQIRAAAQAVDPFATSRSAR